MWNKKRDRSNKKSLEVAKNVCGAKNMTEVTENVIEVTKNMTEVTKSSCIVLSRGHRFKLIWSCFKNSLLCMNSELSKIRSVHTHLNDLMHRMFYFEWYCK